jgi:uncharacterized repeat protein (TIGR01451 family)
MTYEGTLAAINAALNDVTYRGDLNYNGPDTITLISNDNGHTGSGGAKTDTDTTSVTVSPVNDPPVNTMPGAQTVNEDTDLGGLAFSIADPDAGSQTVRFTLSATHGNLTLAGLTDLSPAPGGNGTHSMTYEGTLANVNAAIDDVTYRGDLNYNGPDTITLVSNDNGHTGSGGVLTDTDTTNVTVRVAADLTISKTIESPFTAPGGDIVYEVVVANAGPSDVSGATLTDTFVPELLNPTWSCTPAGGATCPAPGSGNINAAFDVPENGQVTFTINARIASAATGSLANTASVTLPGGVLNLGPGDDSATVSAVLTPRTDLSVSKTSELTGTDITYTIVVNNAGPSDADGATVSDPVPVGLSGFSGTCTTGGGATCAWGGSGDIDDTVQVPAGGVITYTFSAVVTVSDTVVNTATVTAQLDAVDPDLNNNEAVNYSVRYLFLPLILRD